MKLTHAACPSRQKKKLKLELLYRSTWGRVCTWFLDTGREPHTTALFYISSGVGSVHTFPHHEYPTPPTNRLLEIRRMISLWFFFPFPCSSWSVRQSHPHELLEITIIGLFPYRHLLITAVLARAPPQLQAFLHRHVDPINKYSLTSYLPKILISKFRSPFFFLHKQLARI